MEVASSVNDHGMLGKLRALAARGATMRREADGTGLVVPRKGKSRASMTPQEFLQALDAGWLTEIEAGAYVLSRRGTTHLRRELNLQAVTKAAAEPVAGDAIARSTAAASPGTVRPHAMPTYNPAESPLTWLRQRRDSAGQPMISATQFDAGERLRAEFERARLMPRVTSSWEFTTPGNRPLRGVPGAGLEISEIAAAAQQRVAAAMRAVGPELSGVLVDVCCLLNGLEAVERKQGWPRRGGKLMLQTALSMLARHYGLEAAQPSKGPAFIRHWGAPDYRPTVEGPAESADDEH